MRQGRHLHVLRRTTEHESEQLRPQLVALDAELERCDQDLDTARAQLSDGLLGAGCMVREGMPFASGTVLMWRNHVSKLQAGQLLLERQRAQLAARRDEIARGLADAVLTMKAIDVHHQQIQDRSRSEQAQLHQATVDELWSGRRGRHQDMS